MPKRLVHLINPFTSKSGDVSYLDVAQPITFESIRLASKHFQESTYRDDWELLLCTAQYEEDVAIIPSFFKQLPNLSSSTADYFPNLNGQKKLPLVKDIFGTLLSLDLADDDIIIYSNIDIAVQDFFYSYVVDALDSLDALVVNRRDLPKISPEGHTYSHADLHTLYTVAGKKHPGYDCFVFPYKSLKDLQLGDVFLGYPPVGSVIKNSIEAVVGRFEVIRDKYITFHIGEDVSWRQDSPVNEAYYSLNISLAKEGGHDFKKMKLL